MYQRYKERFGTAGVVLGVIALILALGGSALAAKKYVTKKEAEKIAKKYAGKPGAPGAAGTNGTNGANGKDGANGSDGTDGQDGTDGKSVETGNATVGECPDGGATVQVAGEAATKKKVCNGAKGDPGSPWTIGGHLPPGETETGVWTGYAGTFHEGNRVVPIPISYSIPLAEPSEKVVFLNEEETKAEEGTEGCELEVPTFEELGAPVGEPVAPPGTLCVFWLEGQETELGIFQRIGENSLFGPETDSPSGALLWFGTSASELNVHGVWAVTAPEAP